MLSHVVSRVADALPKGQIVVATSDDRSDDPIECYVRSLGIDVYRGSLDDVLGRFQGCLDEHPCDWFFRVCADSPLLDPGLIRAMSAFANRTDLDLVTNTFPRSFPRGRSLEMINPATFASLDSTKMSAPQREHITRIYYDHPQRFRIVNVDSGDRDQAKVNLCVDTIEDLRRLESEYPPTAPAVGEKATPRIDDALAPSAD